jgi:hypothetical protein
MAEGSKQTAKQRASFARADRLREEAAQQQEPADLRVVITKRGKVYHLPEDAVGIPIAEYFPRPESRTALTAVRGRFLARVFPCGVPPLPQERRPRWSPMPSRPTSTNGSTARTAATRATIRRLSMVLPASSTSARAAKAAFPITRYVRAGGRTADKVIR